MFSFIQSLVNPSATRFSKYFNENEDFRSLVAEYIGEDATAYRFDIAQLIDKVAAKENAAKTALAVKRQCQAAGLSEDETERKRRRAYCGTMQREFGNPDAVVYPSALLVCEVRSRHRTPEGRGRPLTDTEVYQLKRDIRSGRVIVEGVMTEKHEQEWLAQAGQLTSAAIA